MKILVLNYEYPPLGGGAAPVTEELASKIAGRGHRIDIVTMSFDGLESYEQDGRKHVHRVSALRGEQSFCRPHEMLSYLPTGFWKAQELLERHGHDIIHSHFIIPTGLIAYALHRCHGVPYIVTAHGSDVPRYNPDRFEFLHSIAAPIWSRVTKEAAVIVSPSEYLGQLIKRRNPDAPITIIPNGFEPHTLDDEREKTQRILASSRLFERKGIQFFIDAISLTDIDWEITITGDGPYKDELEHRVKETSTSAQFLGWVDREELEELLETSAIYVFPSSHENCPVSLQEAMAAGCGIIASKYGGTGEIIGDAGLTVDPKDSNAFAKAITTLVESPDYRKSLQRKARRRLEERYSWDRITDEYLDVITQIIDESENATSLRTSSQ